jgi:hypothetical protein
MISIIPLTPSSLEAALTSKIRSTNQHCPTHENSKTHLIGTKFLSSAVMTVLATPLLEVVGSLCTALLAIGVGRLIELEAILGSLVINMCPKGWCGSGRT